ncbi:phage adaptor protein [Frigidibacter oleivorans]|uniref:phage adaptor protein n=1 Tax=Frigidibacter oleivorans TaxID=2487129 RepID=UPI000F8EF59D|nr:DUF6682 family protein [Frigidibacter oleivorans]
MAFRAKDVMRRASTILQDSGAVHWLAAELFAYLQDGIREVVAIKPNANSRIVILSLVAGTRQELPAEYSILSRVIRNIVQGQEERGGAAIRPIDRSVLDAQIPGWQDKSVMPFARAVLHVVHDMTTPRQFYVVPGNNGEGRIEAAVGVVPLELSGPTGSAMLDVEAYDSFVDLPDLYRNPLVDYVLYRALSKDSGEANAAARATAHYSSFTAALGAINTGEAAMSLGSR